MTILDAIGSAFTAALLLFAPVFAVVLSAALFGLIALHMLRLES